MLPGDDQLHVKIVAAGHAMAEDNKKPFAAFENDQSTLTTTVDPRLRYNEKEKSSKLHLRKRST